MRRNLTVFLLFLASLMSVSSASAQDTRTFGVYSRTTSSFEGPFTVLGDSTGKAHDVSVVVYF